jgi:hypothetical protein
MFWKLQYPDQSKWLPETKFLSVKKIVFSCPEQKLLLRIDFNCLKYLNAFSVRPSKIIIIFDKTMLKIECFEIILDNNWVHCYKTFYVYNLRMFVIS